MVRTAHGVVCSSAASVRRRHNATGGSQRAEQRASAKSGLATARAPVDTALLALGAQNLVLAHVLGFVRAPRPAPRAERARVSNPWLPDRLARHRGNTRGRHRGGRTGARVHGRRPERARRLCARRVLGLAHLPRFAGPSLGSSSSWSPSTSLPPSPPAPASAPPPPPSPKPPPAAPAGPGPPAAGSCSSATFGATIGINGVRRAMCSSSSGTCARSCASSASCAVSCRSSACTRCTSRRFSASCCRHLGVSQAGVSGTRLAPSRWARACTRPRLHAPCACTCPRAPPPGARAAPRPAAAPPASVRDSDCRFRFFFRHFLF